MKWRPALMTIGGIWALSTIVGYAQKPTEVATPVHASMQDDSLRRFARLAASYELARIHAKELDTNEQMRPAWDLLWDQLLAETHVDASWKARVIAARPRRSVVSKERGKQAARETQDDTTLTDFERRAVEKVEQGADEVLERPTPRDVLYLRSIRPLKSCRVCHADSGHVDLLVATRSNEIDGTKISLIITLGKQKPAKK